MTGPLRDPGGATGHRPEGRRRPDGVGRHAPRIEAERREEEKTEEKGYVRHEMHYGSFARTLPLPEGVSEADIKATYKDGILDIRVSGARAGTGQEISVDRT